MSIAKVNDTASTQIEQRLEKTMRSVEDEIWFVIRQDVYAIPHFNSYLLYAPLNGILLFITNAGLAHLLLNPDIEISQNLFDKFKDSKLKQTTTIDSYPKQNKFSKNINKSQFYPTQLTLSLTSICQLACSYCYIKGGENTRSMPLEIAKASINYVTKEAKIAGLKSFSLEFHGQGEATANWQLFTKATEIAREHCNSLGLHPQLSIVTNGILSPEKVSFLARHKFSVTISMDGLKEIMDLQRPMRNGNSSFEAVMKTINQLEDYGVDFSIRVTVTPFSLPKLYEFVEYIRANTTCQYIYIEPVCSVGRALDNNISDSDIAKEFILQYKQIINSCNNSGLHVGYSGCRLDGLRSSFCGGYGHNSLNFCVSTEGLVSSCYEVLDVNDTRANIFIYGKYNALSGSFDINSEKLIFLCNLTVEKMQRCRDCFAKWNCGGDCIAKIALGGLNHILNDSPNYRCYINREITKIELLSFLKLGYK